MQCCIAVLFVAASHVFTTLFADNIELRSLLLTYHQYTTAEELFKVVLQSYSILSESVKRKKLDISQTDLDERYFFACRRASLKSCKLQRSRLLISVWIAKCTIGFTIFLRHACLRPARPRVDQRCRSTNRLCRLESSSWESKRPTHS